MIAVCGHFVFAGRVGGAEQMFYSLLRGFLSNGVPFSLLCSQPTNFDPIFTRELAAANTPIIGNNSRQKRFISEQMSVLSVT
jgi:hypothetical protein